MVDRSGLRSIMRQGGRSPTRGRGRLKYGDPTKIDRDRRQVLADVAARSGLRSLRGRLKHGDPKKIERDRRQVLADVAANKNMSGLDRAALATATIPLIGDVVGGISDIEHLYKDPSLANLGFLAAGLVPFIPSGTVNRQIRKAIVQAPNEIPGFYNKIKNPILSTISKGAAVAAQVPRGLANLTQALYSPTYRGIFKEQGLSVPDVKVAKKFMEKYKKKGPESEEIRAAGKVAMGQQRQSLLLEQQYRDPTSFRDIYKGYDEVGFADKFGSKQYYEMLGGPRNTGLTKKTLDSMFKETSAVQNINPKKNYQMTVRRPHTQAAGTIGRIYNKEIFGGYTGGQLAKKVFKGKPFKSNEEFLKALKENRVGVRNPKAVLKGEPAIVTGNFASDSFELGGVNAMTAIKKDGKITSIISDEHDIGRVKAPGADRMISVSTPITLDLLKTEGKAKRVSSKVAKAEEARRLERQGKKIEIETELGKLPGVDTSLKVPSGMSRPQFYLIQAAAKAKPGTKDYERLAKEVATFAPLRVIQELRRQEQENKRGGGSVMERNPYDYEPRGI